MRNQREIGNVPVPARDTEKVGRCAAPGCGEHGGYRAPRSRVEMNCYIWLCLDHVREYNAAWDFCAGMDAREIEARIRDDVTWRRPSWPLGAAGRHRFDGQGATIRDDFGVFGNSDYRFATASSPGAANGWTPESDTGKALAVLELSPPVTAVAVKARYKELAKQLHPDANGGDKSAEERLKLVNRAYTNLKNSDCFEWQTR